MIQGNQIIEELRLYIHNEIIFALDYTMITLYDVSPSFSFDGYDNFDKVVFPISIIFLSCTNCKMKWFIACWDPSKRV